MLDKLPKETVQRNLDLMRQLLEEDNPDVDVSSGPYHDVLLYYSAIFTTAAQQQMTDALKLVRVGNLIKNPEEVSVELVDAIAANWLLKRNQGAVATAELTIVLHKPTGLVIPTGTTFQLGNTVFKTNASYIVRGPNGPPLQANDRVLTQRADGWLFTIPVEATKIGTHANLHRGTTLRTDFKHPAIKRVFVADDIKSGQDVESNRSLLDRLQTGVIGKNLNTRPNITALLNSRFPRTKVSVVGFNEPELLRDAQKTGGHVDVYLWPEQGTKAVTARVYGIFNGKTVEIILPRRSASGIYYIRSIHTEYGEECKLITQKLKYSMDGLPGKVHVNSAEHVGFSAVQQINIEVECKAPTKMYVVEMTGIPEVGEAQNIVMDKHIANPAADVLVRAPIPYIVKTHIHIDNLSGKDLDIEYIKTIVANYINRLGFESKLNAADVYGMINKHYKAQINIRDINFNVNVLLPEHQTTHEQQGTSLTLPNIPKFGISPRTAVFVQERDNVFVKIGD